MFRLRGLTKSINVFFLKLHLTWQPFYNPTEWISFSFFVNMSRNPKSEKKKKKKVNGIMQADNPIHSKPNRAKR